MSQGWALIGRPYLVMHANINHLQSCTEGTHIHAQASVMSVATVVREQLLVFWSYSSGDVSNR